MKKCTNCNNWIDQPAPNGQALCDECFVSLAAQKQPATNRARSFAEARQKQFAAMVKHGKTALSAMHINAFNTIWTHEKMVKREAMLNKLADKPISCTAEYMSGWLDAFREMKADRFWLAFCHSWAFNDNTIIESEYVRGQAAAFRTVHKI